MSCSPSSAAADGGAGRSRGMKRTFVGLVALGALALGTAAWAADPVAYVTEIQKKAGGEVRVRGAGESEWKAPRPLLALRPGDQIQGQGDARAVVLFPPGGGPKTVTPPSSPSTVAAPSRPPGP